MDTPSDLSVPEFDRQQDRLTRTTGTIRTEPLTGTEHVTGAEHASDPEHVPEPEHVPGRKRPVGPKRAAARALLRRAAPALALFAGIRVLGLVVLAVWAGAEGRSPHQVLSARWDALWYTDIAAHGYHWAGYQATAHTRGAGTRSHLAFFPLLPWLERGLHEAVGLSYADAGLAVSAVASLVAALGIFAVGERIAGPAGGLTTDSGTGRRVALVLVVLWAALPIGVLESMAYTEALFTALAAWSLWCVLRGSWITAGLLSALAGLTRPSAAAIIAAVWAGALLALWRREAPLLRVVAGMLLAPAGLLAYAGWVGGIPAYFRIQNGWGNGFDFGAAYERFVGHQLTTSPAAGVGLLVFVGLVLWALVACVRQRPPLAVVVYAAVIVVLALGAQAYFNSKPRLLLPGFPLLLPLAAWLARIRTSRAAATLGVLTAVSAAYGAIWLLGPGPP